MKTNLKFLFIVSALAFFFSSCDEGDTIELDTETQTAVDDYKSQAASTQIFSTVNHYGINEEAIKSIKEDYPIITVSDTIFPIVLTVDFGPVGSEGFDGVSRTGKLEITYTGKWFIDPEAGTSASVNMIDYYVDGDKLEGEYTITYNGKTNEQPKFTITAENAVMTTNLGSVISWNSTQTIEWIEGFDDDLLENDKIVLGGSSIGTSSEGLSYETNITTPLLKDMSCEYDVFLSGVYELTPEGKETREIDFGSGECDSEATITIGTYSDTIEL